MREPAFWWQPPSWQSRLLVPFGMLYGAVTAWRMRREGEACGLPVICVGNYHLGGAGKTPLVIALIGLLREMGERPVVLSRGYGGRMHGPVLVTDKHDARDVGDEPILIAHVAPIVVARDRIAGAARARAIGASVVIMDDGLQNPALRKDLTIVVTGGRRGIGNGAVFPAGPLRAPLSVQIPRTDLLMVVGDGDGAGHTCESVASRGVPVLHAGFRAHEASLAALGGRRVFAFAGIGDPERFFETLRSSGIDVVRSRNFPDHHPYTIEEIERLLVQATEEKLIAVTTEKDMMRLRAAAATHADLNIQAFAVTLDLPERGRLREIVADTLKSFRSSEGL